MKVGVAGRKELHVNPPTTNEVLALQEKRTGKDVLVFAVPTPQAGVLYAFVDEIGVSYLQPEDFTEHVRTYFTYNHSGPLSKMEVILHA